ncbi:putative Tetratricopeptide repeat protein [Candidatus Sulfotelmatobacter kueseliae]|uniref:Putative Tetratricopeptide repeat protein n=1 Tax=Candidatus Sulfotelmatobacter kueseliae TaxID=2042962 RepID=A0A2U3JXZ7_9BACT|nr:putative Tetratricopeptide repeat protein [Candidatus Sulfotelmatobacter kueseliae]
MQKVRVLICSIVMVLIVPAVAQTAAHSKSPQAFRLYQEGLRLQENRRSYEAMQKWREATKLDPNLALAWAMLSIVETSPDSAREDREKARNLIEHQPQGGVDDLLIRWIVSRSETELMYSIQVANDLVSKHPDQKRILWTVGSWYGFQMHQYDQDVALQEAALKIDPDFAPALDELGFAYAHLQRFDRAVEMIRRYAEQVPNEPNSEDSYGEVLRLAGRYEDSLEHYRRALKILPTFESSQLGLGDTYALMGDEKKAREEYEKCSSVGPVSVRLDCRKMSIYTYVREGNDEEAAKLLTDFAQQMHSVKRISLELESVIALGLIAKKTDAAFGYFDQAIAAAKASKTIPPSDREETMARVMAYKVRIASANGENETAQKVQAELEAMDASTKDPNVYAAMQGGRGALLYYQEKYDDASGALQDDANDMFSTLLLTRCYEHHGGKAAAYKLKKSIVEDHTMDIDLALVQREIKGRLSDSGR